MASPDRLLEFGYFVTEKARGVLAKVPTYAQELREYGVNLPGRIVNHMIHVLPHKIKDLKAIGTRSI